MRQAVVITLIIMGSLLVAAPLLTGAFETWAITQTSANISDPNTLLLGQMPAYPWVCLGVGTFLIGVAVVGEWLCGRRAASVAVGSAKPVTSAP